MTYSPNQILSLSPFEETIVAERTPVFNISSVNPLTAHRNVITGTPTDTDTEYQLNAGDKIETAQIGRYVPGFAAEAGIGVRISSLPSTGQVMRWGYYDDNNGFFFEMDDTGETYVVQRRNTLDTRTPSSSWNNDLGDGSGSTGFTFDPARGNIFQIRFTWYGYGQVEFSVMDTHPSDPGGRQSAVVVHRWSPDGETSIVNPNLPITAEVTGAGTGVMNLGGRQFSIIGRYVAQQRSQSKQTTVSTVGTTWTPIIAFRRKTDTASQYIPIRAEGVSVLVTGSDVQIALVENSNLTFGTPVEPDLTSQSAVEFSVDPSGFSIGNGESMLMDIVGSGGNKISNSQSWPSLELPIAGQRPLVLLARALSGTADVTALLTAREEW